MNSKTNTVTPDGLKEKENKLVISYKTLRNLIGFCGMILPVLLLLTTTTAPSDKIIEPSFSDYYYTNSGDVLVAFLCILGAFLFIYKGYNIKENILSTLAGICGVFAAFSPTAMDDFKQSFSVHTPIPIVPEILGFELHSIISGLFFIILGIISLTCFPKTDNNSMNNKGTDRQKKRNNVYKICGWTLLISVPVMAIYFVSDRFSSMFGTIPFIFLMETIATWAFGISWLTIGGTFYPDGEHYLVAGYREFKEHPGSNFLSRKSLF